jgi:heptosyltransferase-3
LAKSGGGNLGRSARGKIGIVLFKAFFEASSRKNAGIESMSIRENGNAISISRGSEDLKAPKRGVAWRREIDRLLGVPALWTLGRFRRRRVLSGEVRRVVFLQTAAIGDTLLMGQSIRKLREAFPQAKLILALGRDNRVAAELLPPCDRVIVINVLSPWSAFRQLRDLKPDILIDYGVWPRMNALLSVLAGATFTAGFNTPAQSRHHAYDYAALHSPDRHEIENHRALLGFLNGPSKWDLSLEIPKTAEIDPPLPAHSYVVFHAWASGTGKRLKEWPSEHWRDLARSLVRKVSGIVLTGGPSDAADTERLADSVRAHVAELPVLSVAGAYSLTQTAVLLRLAKAVVSVNTGVMHLAALLGVPTVGLHGPTDPKRWGPFGENVVSLVPGQGVHSYLHLGFEFPRTAEPCLHHLLPGQVVAALSRWI